MESVGRTFRVVMIGDSQTGKTSIVGHIAGQPIDSPLSTVGASVIQDLSIPSPRTGTSVSINLWDTAGQERYRSLGPMYYKNSDAAMAVFDLTNPESFDHLEIWVQTFCDVVVGGVISILGNKSDLLSERQVTDAHINTFLATHHCTYFETSAKTGAGIQEAFTQLADDLLTAGPAPELRSRPVRLTEKKAEDGELCC
jgi:small GTP-binding protein